TFRGTQASRERVIISLTESKIHPEVIQQFWQQLYRHLPDPALPNRHSDGQQMGVKISVAIESAEFGHTYDDFITFSRKISTLISEDPCGLVYRVYQCRIKRFEALAAVSATDSEITYSSRNGFSHSGYEPISEN
ncbi:hypothetical protein ACTXT7_016544, partial [Hymenolepis weldensis]